MMNNVESFYPLSPMQEGMLYHTLYAPGSAAYVRQMSFRLAGAVDVGAYHRAWQAMLERHQILRTIFLWKEVKTPVQVVRREAELPFERLDWRGQTTEEHDTRLRDFLEQDRARGFDLTRAPLMRLVVIQLDTEAFHFVWSFHHLLLDGWSVSVLLKELSAVWRDFARGTETAHLGPARPYRDYIVWLRRQDEAGAERFWRRELEGVSEPTPLPARPAPEGDGGVCQAQQQIRLSAEESAALQAFARRHRLTPNTVAQCAWALLLSHLADRRDVVFGTPVSGRPSELAGVENMVGMFVNTLPLRVQVAPAEALAPWLRNLQTRQVESRRYEYCSLVQLQLWSGLPRGARLFDSLLTFHNYLGQGPAQPQGGGPAAEGETSLGDIRSVSEIGFPLEMEVLPTAGATVLTLRYDAARFAATVAERMLGGFAALLRAAAAGDASTVGDLLEYLRADDRRWQSAKEEAFEEAAAKKLKGLRQGLRNRAQADRATTNAAGGPTEG
jgi:hypothetical protein